MMKKIGIEVAQDEYVLNNLPSIPQKYLKSQDIKIVVGTGVKTAPIFSLPEKSKEKFSKETPRYALIMDTLKLFWPQPLRKGSSNIYHQKYL